MSINMYVGNVIKILNKLYVNKKILCMINFVPLHTAPYSEYPHDT